MKNGDSLHGFTVLRSQFLKELQATLYELRYDKNGARLLWLDRDDDNMTFAIGFKTPPRDDTGVFHIIEHSVLCGSDKYPVKDPFVILLKSSLQTFLNALTFSDKTVYPVCSRNRQDFLNLMDVYLDAVLHPLSAQDPHAFLQEGWHYELSEDGTLTRNGVVYNEMKGSFSNPDVVLANTLERALYPDTCYGCVSGGDPEHIPELTYQTYLDNYHRCYHPSNAYIFLDGSIDVDAVLAKLDSFLCDFDAAETDTEIPMQSPVCPPQIVASYEIDAEEDGTDKVLFSDGYVYDGSDLVSQYACDILEDLLVGTNDAPLKRALLEQELCEDVEFDNNADIQQPFVSITVRNTSEDKAERCRQVIRDTLAQICDEGLDRAQLHAAIDHLEFTQREKDSGRTPIGLIFGIYALDKWLYGGDPSEKLEPGPTFTALRAFADHGGFEALLRSIVLESKHCASVMLLPDAALGKARQEAEAEQLAAIKATWTPSQIAEVESTFETLRRKQETPDSPAQLATLPKLSLKDLPEQPRLSHAGQTTVGGYSVIHTQKNTNGISYLTFYFSLADMTLEELSRIDFLADLLGEIATESYTPTQLYTLLQSVTGHLLCHVSTYSPCGTDTCDPYFEVCLAVLEEKKDEALALIREMLCKSLFDNQKAIRNVLWQETDDMEQAVLSSGHSVALQRCMAGLTAGGAVGDATHGIGKLRWLQNAKAGFDGNAEAFCEGLSDLCKRIFVRSRLRFALTGTMDADWIVRAAECFPEGAVCQPIERRPLCLVPCGYQIPARIAFAAKIFRLGQHPHGASKVASKILSLDYLWNEVRVKGGAYGVGFHTRLSGGCIFYTYRDPNPAGALCSYEKMGEALRDFCSSDSTVDDYIISSIADLQPLMSPRTEGQQNASDILSGVTEEILRTYYTDVLHTTKEDLIAFSRLFDEKQGDGVICVIGSKQTLDACGDTLKHRELLLGAPATV